MTNKNHRKVFKQLKAKPAKLKKFLKHNAPKKRKFGMCARRCRLCGSFKAHIRRYGLHLCRRCFREEATKIGFRKYS